MNEDNATCDLCLIWLGDVQPCSYVVCPDCFDDHNRLCPEMLALEVQR